MNGQDFGFLIRKILKYRGKAFIMDTMTEISLKKADPGMKYEFSLQKRGRWI